MLYELLFILFIVCIDEVKSSHLYLYSAFYNTDCLDKTVMASSSSVQFSYNGVNAGRSIILLNIVEY